MPLSDRHPVRNRLLCALPSDALGLLRPQLDPVQVSKDEVIIRPGEVLESAYFPEGGLSSVVSKTREGHRLEVGAFGYDGMTSTATVLGAGSTPHGVLVQVGGTWLRIGAEALRHAMRQSPALHGLMLRYVQTFLLSVTQTAHSNGAFKTEERLARWLLIAHDRLEGDDLPLTHEFLSIMLGVHRPGVTVALHMLEGAGTIRAKRGMVTVLDRGKLEQTAGGSYGTAEAEYERLIGPYRKRGVGPAQDRAAQDRAAQDRARCAGA